MFANILHKLWGIFKGSDFDKKVKRLSNRIDELKYEKRAVDKRINSTKSYSFDLSWFVMYSSPIVNNKEIKTFVVHAPIKITTMNELYTQRKLEEEKRIANMRQQIRCSFDKVQELIDSEDAELAENLLFQISPLLNEFKDDNFNDIYNELLFRTEALKKVLHQRQIEIQNELARQKVEEEKRAKEQKRLEISRKLAEKILREENAKRYEDELIIQDNNLRNEIERLTLAVTQKKDDAVDIVQYLLMKGVRCFYHFTDRQNLNSIRRYGGLYSWYYCKKNNIVIPNAGGTTLSKDLDVRHGLQDYVRLSFCDDHPMAYRKHKDGADVVLLAIDINVAAFKDTLFSDKNAASNSFLYGEDLDSLKNVNIMATKRHYVSRDEGDIFHQHQAECMVKTFIPIKYIMNINNPQKMIFS